METTDEPSLNPEVRFITIRVVGREAPELDISDFSAYEAQSILQACADKVDETIQDPILTAAGYTWELVEVLDEEED